MGGPCFLLDHREVEPRRCGDMNLMQFIPLSFVALWSLLNVAGPVRCVQNSGLERYRSFRRRFRSLLSPVFKVQPGSGRKEDAPIRPGRQRVLQIKENRIDETSLAVILERRQKRVEVGGMGYGFRLIE